MSRTDAHPSGPLSGSWPALNATSDGVGPMRGLHTPGAARDDGMRRLSRLTWRATQLSAITAVAFATLFARTANAHTTATANPVVRPPPHPSPSPTRSPVHKKRRLRHHHAGAAAAPASTPTPTPTSGAAPPAAPTPAPTHTLAPPPTPPQPPHRPRPPL